MIPRVAIATILCFLLAAQVSASMFPVQQDSDQRHQAQIKKVETGLGPSVMFEGDQGRTIEERMKHHGVPGLGIAVIKDNKVIWAKAYGVKDRKSGKAVDTNTLFQCASISKPVSAAAALRLVEQGKLKLDEDINDYLKSWKLPANKFTKDKPVTLRHLLSHTGGVTVHGFRGYRSNEKVPTLVELLNGASPANSRAIVVDKAPGGKYRYSGGGYCVFQQAMIDVTGKTFEQLLNEEILKTLEMNRCTFAQPLPEERALEAAAGYLPNGKPVKGQRHVYPEMAAAGLYATPSQLALFWIELQKAYAGKSDRLLSKSMARQMLKAVDDGYGLGVGVMDKDGEVYIGHGGWNEGFVCNALVHRDRGYGVVVMTNGNKPDLIDEVISSVARVYEWKHTALPVYTKLAPDKDAEKKILGRYQHKWSLVEFKMKKDQLVVETMRGGQHPVYRVGDNQFATRAFEDVIFVREDASGSVELELKKPWQSKATKDNVLQRLTEEEKTPSELLASGEIDKAIESYLEIQKRSPTAPSIQEDYLNELGYEYLGDEKVEQAIRVFRVNVALYPNAFNTYDSLGEAYLLKGEKELGIRNYRKSLELNPENQYAIEALERLDK